MSDYDWYCPSCGVRMHWNDDGLYSHKHDDTVCSECWLADEESQKFQRYMTENHGNLEWTE